MRNIAIAPVIDFDSTLKQDVERNKALKILYRQVDQMKDDTTEMLNTHPLITAVRGNYKYAGAFEISLSGGTMVK